MGGEVKREGEEIEAEGTQRKEGRKEGRNAESLF
jgi:hypothetical protein